MELVAQIAAFLLACAAALVALFVHLEQEQRIQARILYVLNMAPEDKRSSKGTHEPTNDIVLILELSRLGWKYPSSRVRQELHTMSALRLIRHLSHFSFITKVGIRELERVQSHNRRQEWLETEVDK